MEEQNNIIFIVYWLFAVIYRVDIVETSFYFFNESKWKSL